MDGQQSYKRSELVEEENKKRQVKFPISQLEVVLYRIVINAKEMDTNEFEIGEYFTIIDRRPNKCGNEDIQRGYNIETFLYSKDKNKVAECRSDPLSYKIKCIDYSGRSFELSDSSSLIEGIESSISELLRDMGEKYNNINIGAGASMYLDKPIKDNPEISIYKVNPEIGEDIYVLSYDNGRFNITMAWESEESSKS